MKKSKEKIYAIYKGDKFIDVGTIKELSQRLGKTQEAIYFMTTPVAKRRDINYNHLVAYQLEDEEIEWLNV